MTSLHAAMVELIGSVDAADEHCAYAFGDVPATDGWRRLDELVAGPSEVQALIAKLLEGAAAGHRDVAGSFLASWLAGPIARLQAAAWLEGGRVLHVELDQVSVRFHDEGWVDGVVLAGAGLTMERSDVAAGSVGVHVVDDPDVRRRLVAHEISAVARPIFAAVRTQAPYGRAGMWGSLADDLACSTLHAEQRRPGGGDPAGAWAAIDALLDELALQTPALRTRPRRQLIPWSGGTRHQSVRGTCCLYYKTAVAPEPAGDGYCSSCPLRPDGSRAERITRWLDAPHA